MDDPVTLVNTLLNKGVSRLDGTVQTPIINTPSFQPLPQYPTAASQTGLVYNVPQQLPIGASSDEKIHTVKTLMDIIPPPAEVNTAVWLANVLDKCPHSYGQAPKDRVLSRAMSRVLNEAGRKEDAKQVDREFAKANPQWMQLINDAALRSPQGPEQIETQINKFKELYQWPGVKPPMTPIQIVLGKVGVPMESKPSDYDAGAKIWRII